MKFSLQNEGVLPNAVLKLLTSKSRSASSWFCMIGRVFSSFSAFMVLITPSILQWKTHIYKFSTLTCLDSIPPLQKAKWNINLR